MASIAKGCIFDGRDPSPSFIKSVLKMLVPVNEIYGKHLVDSVCPVCYLFIIRQTSTNKPSSHACNHKTAGLFLDKYAVRGVVATRRIQHFINTTVLWRIFGELFSNVVIMK